MVGRSPFVAVLVLGVFPSLTGCHKGSSGPTGPSDQSDSVRTCDGPPESCLLLGSGWVFEGTVIANPNVVDVSVVRLPDGSYRMYGGEGAIEVPTFISTDGRMFIRESSVTDVKANDTFRPTVISIPSGGYRMYLSVQAVGPVGEGYRSINSAWSDDGLNFIIDAGARLTYLGTGNEAAGISRQQVVPLPSGGFRMYYFGYESSSSNYLLSAISNDGLSWTREPGIRIDPSSLCPPVRYLHNVSPVYDASGRLHLFTNTSLCTGQYRNEKNGIWDATSTDGLNFVFPGSPVVERYYRKSQYTGNPTDPVVMAEDPAAVLTPFGFRVFFGLYAGQEIIPESGIYSVRSGN